MADPNRQLAMVIDLNKCMGCQTCTVACKVRNTNDKGMDHQWWMKVTTMPGRGYPKDWEQMGGGYDADGNVMLGKKPEADDYGGEAMEFNYEEVIYGRQGQEVHLAPRVKPSWGPNWEEDVGSGEWPNAYFFYLPRLCNGCNKPSCAGACPHDAISKRKQDGIIAIDQRTCETCSSQDCMSGCPYKEIYYNPVTLSAQKCDGCVDRVEDGVAPACVRGCPGRAMWVDYLDNEAGTVHKAVKQYEVALPLHPEFGTEPNVFYVPPIGPPSYNEDGTLNEDEPRVPIEYLEKLFGPRVHDALTTLRAEMAKRRREPKEESELTDALVAKRYPELLGELGNDPGGIEEVRA
ncbi:MAG: respiratory nitrate reductase subunit beta [Kiritimatiellia bacterium]|jgi:DMSO reductase family type II enzyme iron-sulfur subunit|nr:respiratory nitrate reductase subunit beta [Pseudomonadales bacterium]MDP6473235.1 respiratory nitrate reductase subunit beta [Pseudomonadales bacterium]MDP6829160.1 respiratory nitrate reductase subunit beta [Pseudomonadales bacterium]MDP7024707.1 respiratory nitrate reductase subunit beta [Kiritimatiellia bacterium]